MSQVNTRGSTLSDLARCRLRHLRTSDTGAWGPPQTCRLPSAHDITVLSICPAQADESAAGTLSLECAGLVSVCAVEETTLKKTKNKLTCQVIIRVRKIVPVTLKAQSISVVSHRRHAVCACVALLFCVHRRGISPKRGTC